MSPHQKINMFDENWVDYLKVGCSIIVLIIVGMYFLEALDEYKSSDSYNQEEVFVERNKKENI